MLQFSGILLGLRKTGQEGRLRICNSSNAADRDHIARVETDESISMLQAMLNDVVAILTNDDGDNDTAGGERRYRCSPPSPAHDRPVLSRSGLQKPASPLVVANTRSRDRMPHTLTMLLFMGKAYIASAKGVRDLENFFVNLS